MRKKALRLFFLIVSYFLIDDLAGQPQKLELLKDGSSAFVVSIPAKSTPDEERAASILRYFFKVVTGFNLPISNATSFPRVITIGQNNLLRAQGFSIQAKSANMIDIKGGMEGGAINGVWFFLRNYVGIDYLAANTLYYSSKKDIQVPIPIQVIQSPSFRLRMIYSIEGIDGDYVESHALSRPFSDHYNFAHSSNEWLPPKDLFLQHPEYYMELNKRRDTLQPNLLHPDVFEIVLKNIRRKISEDSLQKFKYYSFSLMDNPFISQDAVTTKKLSTGKFNYTDILLSFVNRLADSIPNSKLTTLAYEQTKAAPKYEVPRKNVTVILTNADNNRSKQLSVDGRDYVLKLDMNAQIKRWTSLDPSIILWDYLSNSNNKLMPWPVLFTIQPNLKLYRKYGIENLFMQLSGDLSSINTELRTYLCANLMWDINGNVDSLIRRFCLHYYGSASSDVYTYITDINFKALHGNDLLFTYDNASKFRNSIFAYSNIVKWQRLLARAALVTQDESFRNRILKEKLGLDCVFLELSTKFEDWNPVDGRAALTNQLQKFRQDCSMLSVYSLNTSEHSLKNFIAELAVLLEEK